MGMVDGWEPWRDELPGVAGERERRWEHHWERRWAPPAHHLLAVLLLAEALLAVGFVLWPPHPPHPPHRGLDALLALLLLVLAVACAATWRRRGPLLLLEGFLVAAWAVPVVFIASAGAEAAQLLWAAIAMLVAALAAFFLPARRALLQVGVLVTVYLVAALTGDPSTRPLFAGAFAVVTVLAAYGVARLRAERDRLLGVIAEMATTDPLTGVLNRRGLQAEAVVVRATAERAGLPTAVAIVDLDGLKEFNDARGHAAGDARIVGCVDQWRAGLRAGDLLARIGGDEFVLVLPHADARAAGDLLARLQDAAPGAWSHGCTTWAPGETLEQAMGRADALMYAEKARRRASGG